MRGRGREEPALGVGEGLKAGTRSGREGPRVCPRREDEGADDSPGLARPARCSVDIDFSTPGHRRIGNSWVLRWIDSAGRARPGWGAVLAPALGRTCVTQRVESLCGRAPRSFRRWERRRCPGMRGARRGGPANPAGPRTFTSALALSPHCPPASCSGGTGPRHSHLCRIVRKSGEQCGLEPEGGRLGYGVPFGIHEKGAADTPATPQKRSQSTRGARPPGCDGGVLLRDQDPTRSENCA